MAEPFQSLETLMLNAQRGDKAAYATLLREVAMQLKPYLRKWLGGSADAEDVLQEILISVHKAQHTYDATRPLKPWLFAIARFRVSEYLRRLYNDRLRNAEKIEDHENSVAASVTNSGDAYEYLNEGLKALPAKQAEIVRFIQMDGYTAREVADKLGMKESAVKVAAHRAYKTLRKMLEA